MNIWYFDCDRQFNQLLFDRAICIQLAMIWIITVLINSICFISMQFFPSVYFVYFFHFVKHFQYSKSTHFDFSETHKRNEQNKYRIIKSVFFIWCAKHESDFNNTFHTYHARSHTFCFFCLQFASHWRLNHRMPK